MRFIIGCLSTAFWCCLYTISFAQAPSSSINGKVLAENHLPAEGASVVLLKFRDSSIVNAATVNKAGEFNFTGLQPDNYLLQISKLGFNKLYAGPYRLSGNKALAVADIVLAAITKQLNEVTVVSNKPVIEFKPGVVTFNVQNSLTATGNSAYDILRQSPGVKLDANDNISIVGRQTALITIDGKPTNLTGEDLTGVLRGMQANTIDKIELITGGSAKYDAAGGGIINIVLKKGKNNGFNATVTGTAGYGKYYKANGGLVFNNRTDKFNVFGSFNTVNNKSFHDFTTDRVIGYNDVTSDYHVDYNGLLNNHSNNFSFGTDYFLSPKQTIGFLINGDFRNDEISKNNNLTIWNNGQLDSTIVANSSVRRNVKRQNYNLNYNNKLDKAGTTLSADFNYTNYSRSSAEYITNDFFDANNNVYRAPLLLQNLSPSNIHIWLSKIDFVHPLNKTSKLEAGVKYNNTKSDNNLVFGPLVNGQYTTDPTISNHFIYTENVNAAYVNYESMINKVELTAGLRAEQTIAKGNSMATNYTFDNKYINLFPHVLLSYQYNDKNSFAFSYNRGIKRPDYREVNPFLAYVDLYDYTSGNPDLKPQYTNTFELSYSHGKAYSVTLYSNIVSNAYEFPFYHQNDSSKVNINIRENLGTIYNYGARFIVPVTFTNWWNADFSTDAAYQRYVSYPQNGNLSKGTQDIYFRTTQHFNIGKTITAEIAGQYETPAFFGINQFKANYFVNAGISKQLFDKRGSIKLNVADIFNTIRDRSHTDFENLNLTTYDKVETRVARLTFTYRFGKSTKAIIHRTGNEEEQGRTNGN